MVVDLPKYRWEKKKKKIKEIIACFLLPNKNLKLVKIFKTLSAILTFNKFIRHIDMLNFFDCRNLSNKEQIFAFVI